LHFQYVPVIWPFLIAAIVTLTLAIYAFAHKNAKGAIPFAFTMLLTSLWAGCYALELAGDDLPTKLFWTNFQSISYTVVPALWLIMVFQFIERENWITRRNVLFLLALPVIAIVLTWTNDLHGLIWQNVYLDEGVLIPVLKKTFGSFFIITVIYAYSVNILSELLLGLSLRRKSALYREQSLALMVGLALLFIPNIFYVFDISPLNHYDFTSAVAGISGLIIAGSIFRFRLFDIVPVARDNIIENMADGVIVLDARNRVVDINQSARAIFGNSSGRGIGVDSGAFFEAWPSIREICQEKSNQPREIYIEKNGDKRIFEVSCLILTDKKGKQNALSVTFHDVTEQRKTQARLLEQQRELAISREKVKTARDLHDRLGQVFGFINVQAQAIKRELSNKGIDIAAGKIDRLIEVTQSAHRDMREFIQSVKTAAAAEKKLVDALNEEAEDFQKQTGIDIRVDICNDLPIAFLNRDTQTQIINIIKEAFNNIRKHAQANRVSVTVRAVDNNLLMTVCDDGKGFEVGGFTKNPLSGLGLNIMKERADEVGGNLDIDSSPGNGTRITLNIPIREQGV
jgi:PAS domain S-box-containing protein